MSRIAIDLDAADLIVAAYSTTSDEISSVRRSLVVPWLHATRELGPDLAPVSDLLRLIDEELRFGGDDLRWRIAYIRERYATALLVNGRRPGRLVVGALPPRPSTLRVRPTASLLDELAVVTDLQRQQRLLEELMVRAVADAAVAGWVIDVLETAGLDRLVATAIAGSDDIAAALLPLQLLVSFAIEHDPTVVHDVVVGEQPADLLRVVALLGGGAYDAATVAVALDWMGPLIADESFRWRYQGLLLSGFPAGDSDTQAQAAKTWLLSFENPALSILERPNLFGSLERQNAEAFALLTMAGTLKSFLNPTLHSNDAVALADELRRWNETIARLVGLVPERLGDLHETASLVSPGGLAGAELTNALQASLALLAELRDLAPTAQINADPVREAAAWLLAWHFEDLASGSWPLEGSTALFARWMAESDAALMALVAGAGSFFAGTLPRVVADFVANPDLPVARSAARPLDHMGTTMQFLAMALTGVSVDEQSYSSWSSVLDLAWAAVLTVAPAAVLPGSSASIRVLRMLLSKFASQGYDVFTGGSFSSEHREQLAPDTVDALLAGLFFTFDSSAGSGLASPLPLELAVFGLLLEHYPDVSASPTLAAFIASDNGSGVPPQLVIASPGDANYDDFLRAFHEVTTAETDFARDYLYLWHEIKAWIIGEVNQVERATS